MSKKEEQLIGRETVRGNKEEKEKAERDGLCKRKRSGEKKGKQRARGVKTGERATEGERGKKRREGRRNESGE